MHLLEYLDLSLPTVMYIHGFNDAARDISVQTVVKAYIKRGGFNILALDWSELCVGDYFRNAIPNVFMVVLFCYLNLILLKFRLCILVGYNPSKNPLKFV